MSAEPISGVVWGAKLAGAAAGSAISIAYLLPRGRQDAAARFLVGLVTGLVFGGPAGLALAQHLRLGDALSPGEQAMMGSAAASLCAWWALGVIKRFADALFRTPAAPAEPREAGQATPDDPDRPRSPTKLRRMASGPGRHADSLRSSKGDRR
ncbi:hypothetical protein Sa4125_12280 [Aureimonas sp. SA4125]|uniref:DUF6107 family protein n=1 Tax=Aureimonas sp. SA4125 TaxID=2826993 RepID=UPI001CC76BEA|nr:DUF6107 family protein [Aureimonas sp. SA4125]BDA83686.1 hypothetical protein Sa4125_12280 [Aureimonas sp. SA4125]